MLHEVQKPSKFSVVQLPTDCQSAISTQAYRFSPDSSHNPSKDNHPGKLGNASGKFHLMKDKILICHLAAFICPVLLILEDSVFSESLLNLILRTIFFFHQGGGKYEEYFVDCYYFHLEK